ncbi:hypothetical protein H0H92_005242 [Tricholoma furcatifolium]|nr:hypothetical protein H0H92_005242 [Tricholoma furcatifolium]
MASDLPTGIVRIRGKFRLKRKLGAGSFGSIYEATNVVNGANFAVKLEPANSKNAQLRAEWMVYQALGSATGIPRVLLFGHEGGYNAMLMTLLGASIEEIFEQQNRYFSTNAVLIIGLQLLQRMEFIHAHNYIHQDIKPTNILLGLSGSSQSTVYITDFGLALYNVPPLSPGLFAIFLRRDDFESLAYVLIYLHTGTLPWQGASHPSSDFMEKSSPILEKKLEFASDDLCRSLPQAIESLLSYSRALRFEEDPDYNYLGNLFVGALAEQGLRDINSYDWLCEFEADN